MDLFPPFYHFIILLNILPQVPMLIKETPPNAACLERNDKDLKEDMVGKSKMTALAKEDCKAKGYLSTKSMKDIRDTFRARRKLSQLV